MYSCPACGADDVMGRLVCRCGADLSLLVRLEEISDAWFNRGIQALADGKPGRAVEWFSTCCAANPNDLEARLYQARAWMQLGHRMEARQSLKRARKLAPDSPEVAALQSKLARVPRRPRPGRRRTPSMAVTPPEVE